MNKSYLVGYYGMKNSGDDALLAATAWGATRYLGSDSFIVNSPIDLSIAFHGCERSTLVEKQSFPSQNRLRQYRSALKSNNIIFGGGSVLQNKRDIDLKRDLITLSGNNGNIALGIGVGPFEDTRAERSCAHFLNACQFVGVRDEISFDIAMDIAPRANIKLTFDLAPTLLKMMPNRRDTSERRGIAVCLCPHERLCGNTKKERRRIKAIAELLSLTYIETGEPIIFVDFNGHPTLGDEIVHRETAALMKNVPHSLVKYNANPFTVLARMSSYKAILSMRLHAAIFGFLADTPVISLNYHEKCLGWCKQAGIPPSMYFPLEDIDSNSLCELLHNGLQDGFPQNTLSISTATTHSLKNWSLANEYLSFENLGRHSFIQ